MEVAGVLAALGLAGAPPAGREPQTPEETPEAQSPAEQAAAALCLEWEDSQRTFPAQGVFFLEPEFVAMACRASHLPPEVTAAALAAAAAARTHPALAALSWHCHRCLFVSKSYPAEAIRSWPALTGRRGVAAGAGPLYLLVLLSGIRETLATHRAHAVPAAVARETLYDIQRWLVREPAAGADAASAAGTGEWYLPPRYLTWLRHHLRGELYHLVRLQFQFGALWSGAHFFRHRATGAVLALSEDGVRYRPEGDVAGERDAAAPDAWQARLERRDGEAVGHPIRPSGVAERRQVRLPNDEWEPALAPGDPVLHLHIPAGSPMDFDRCGESLRQALSFFPRHFPERPFKALACSSWLLDSQLEALLPDTANIVRLQREVYQLPSRPGGRATLERVFGHVPAGRDEIARLPRDTTLRRAVADHLLAGGEMRSGRCVLFPQDLRWGEQVYRRQWAATDALLRACD